MNYQEQVRPAENKLGWGVLGCCMPIVGLILFLVWNTERPEAAKAAGIGALIGVITFIALYAMIIMLAIASGGVTV